jgi:hypothetical protein
VRRNQIALVFIVILSTGIGYAAVRLTGQLGLGIATSAVLNVVAIGGFTYWQMIRPSMAEGHLLQTGTAAVATIKEVWSTGLQYSGRRQIRLLLEVGPAGEAPFEPQARTFVLPDEAGLYQPGTRVQIRYDPNDRKTVAVVGPQ